MKAAETPEAPKIVPPRNAQEARVRQAAKRTPEQTERYIEVSRRALALQERGVAVPKSGTFGGQPKAAKR